MLSRLICSAGTGFAKSCGIGDLSGTEARCAFFFFRTGSQQATRQSQEKEEVRVDDIPVVHGAADQYERDERNEPTRAEPRKVPISDPQASPHDASGNQQDRAYEQQERGKPVRIMVTSQNASTVEDTIHCGRSHSPRPMPVHGLASTLPRPCSQICNR